MNGGQVLLATGDDVLVAALQSPLSAEGIQVDRHLDVRTLPQRAAQLSPRVVIMGPEALDARPAPPVAAIKDLCGHHAIILGLLATGDEQEVQRAVELGVDDFMVPPVRVEELRSRLRAAVRRSHAMEDQEGMRRDAAVLQELTQTLSSGLPAHTILHAASRLVASSLNAERCAIVMVDLERNEGTVVAVSEDRNVRDLRVDLARYPEILHMVDTGAPVVVRDAAADPLLSPVHNGLPGVVSGSILLFPILTEEKVMGALFLRSKAVRPPPTEREVQFGSTVALAIGATMRATRLHNTTRSGVHAVARRPPAESALGMLHRFESFFEDAPDGVVILDDSGTVVYSNREGAGLFDVSPKDMVGHEITAFLSMESVPVLRAVLADVAHDRFRKNFDLYALREGNEERCLSCSAGAVGEASGDRRMCMISFRDVTQLREMQNELKATKEFLENLIDSSVDAIMAADMRGNIILFNKGAEKLFGYRAEDVIGNMRISRLYPGGVPREIMVQLRSDAHGGRGKLEASRKTILTRGGEEVPVSLTASIIYENGEEVATVGIFSDLRERLKMEDTLSQTQERLLKTEKAAVVAQLAGTAAHELNQPLTSILGYAEMLKGRVPETSPLRRPVDIIFREGERMADIVKKIGRITKYETKNYVGNTMIVDLERASSDPRAAPVVSSPPTPAVSSPPAPVAASPARVATDELSSTLPPVRKPTGEGR